jgi:hypothetical protein
MIIIEEDPLTKRLEKRRRKERLRRGRRGPSHHSSKIIFRDKKLPRSPE